MEIEASFLGPGRRRDLDLIEFNTHSFVVKIWREDPAGDPAEARWRGHITHVPSGDRRYLKSLNEVVAFMVPYLVSMGVRVDALGKVLSWFGGDSREGTPERQAALRLEK
jgi:hypothetical protein